MANGVGNGASVPEAASVAFVATTTNNPPP